MVELVKNNPPRGVDYITKNNKEKQRKTMLSNGSSFLGEGVALKVNDLGIEGYPSREEKLVSQEETPAPTPLTQRDVITAIVQLWDNGEKARQRYKLKVRLNLVDGSTVDMIAPLTKDPRNFLKHTYDKELAREWRRSSKQYVQSNFGVKPWLGKFHEVRSQYTSRFHQIRIEPNCFATVWYDSEAHEWTATIKLYGYEQEDIDMQKRNVTGKQSEKGCISSKMIKNPEHQPERPKTWAEKRLATR